MKTIVKLQKLVEKKKSEVMKEYNRKGGYFENMGMKQLRQIEEAAMNIAHSSSESWEDRQNAYRVVSSFDRWLESV